MPIGRRYVLILSLIALSNSVACLGNKRYIRTGIMTDKQKTSATSKVMMIFSVKTRSLKITTDKADIKSARFLKLMTVTIAPNPKAFGGVILSIMEKKRGSSSSTDAGLRQFLNASQRSKVPKNIKKTGKKVLDSLVPFSVAR